MLKLRTPLPTPLHARDTHSFTPSRCAAFGGGVVADGDASNFNYLVSIVLSQSCHVVAPVS